MFNHRQYTAERDTLKVMTKMILSMTGDKMEDFNDRYDDFKAEVPTASVTDAIRHANYVEKVNKNLEEYKNGEPSQKEVDNLMTQLKKEEEEQKKRELDEAMNKDLENVNTFDKHVLCTENEEFKKQLIEEYKELFKGFLSDQHRNIMTKPQVYTPLMLPTGNFCSFFDKAVEYETKTTVENTVKDGIKNIFKAALLAAKNMRVTDLAQRIIIAQKITDITLNKVSPVGFRNAEWGAYGKGYMVLKAPQEILELMGNDMSKDEFEKLMTVPKETFAKMYPENVMTDSESINVNIPNDSNGTVPPVNTNIKELGGAKVVK